jgi:Cu(I)/Ag(I) efflux system membrane protein CusA/SilA
MRRGLADLDGAGEVVSGIVIMRDGVNAQEVTSKVKARLQEIAHGLPEGVRVVPIYDRSELVQRVISNLRSTLLEIVVTVVLVILLFLWHPPSALIPAITIPVTVLIAFIPFRLLGLSANIMSLCGVAIAIGALVDAAIVVVEQVHKNLEKWDAEGRPTDERAVVLAGIKQVAAPGFFALVIIAVSFLPVLALEAQEGQLFKPLAYAKSISMLLAAVLTITLDPALRMSLTRLRARGKDHRTSHRWVDALLGRNIVREDRNPISRALSRSYDPILKWCLKHRGIVLATAAGLILVTIPAFLHLGTEFMPSFEEGTLLYMPSTAPSVSVTEAKNLLQSSDAILRTFPEVEAVLGKAGRFESATDPAPLSMLETLIRLKPKSESVSYTHLTLPTSP